MILTALAVVLPCGFILGSSSVRPVICFLKKKRWIAIVGVVVVLLAYTSIYRSVSMDGQVSKARGGGL